MFKYLVPVLAMAVVVALPRPQNTHSFQMFEKTLQLEARDEAKTLAGDVERSQGKAGVDQQTEGSNTDSAKMLRTALAQRTKRNLDFLRGTHIRCVKNPNSCGNYVVELQRPERR